MNCDELIGRPYKIGGRGPVDFDCWGLCMHIAGRMGVSLPELAIPEVDDLRAELVERQRACYIKLTRPTSGCLALFRVIDDHQLVKWHIGIVLPDCRHFIHTTQKLGVHVAPLDRQPWKLFIEGFYSYQP